MSLVDPDPGPTTAYFSTQSIRPPRIYVIADDGDDEAPALEYIQEAPQPPQPPRPPLKLRIRSVLSEVSSFVSVQGAPQPPADRHARPLLRIRSDTRASTPSPTSSTTRPRTSSTTTSSTTSATSSSTSLATTPPVAKTHRRPSFMKLATVYMASLGPGVYSHCPADHDPEHRCSGPATRHGRALPRPTCPSPSQQEAGLRRAVVWLARRKPRRQGCWATRRPREALRPVRRLRLAGHRDAEGCAARPALHPPPTHAARVPSVRTLGRVGPVRSGASGRIRTPHGAKQTPCALRSPGVHRSRARGTMSTWWAGHHGAPARQRHAQDHGDDEGHPGPWPTVRTRWPVSNWTSRLLEWATHPESRDVPHQ